MPDTDAKTYRVQRSKGQFTPDLDWNSPFWNSVETLSIENYMGQKPDHLPETKAKICYDPDNLYIIFKVDDKYVRCVATEYGQNVWEDSCVEFFFTPNNDPANGYFNIETNACGTFLMAHQISRNNQCTPVAWQDASKIQIYHSLPDRLETEITAPNQWTLQYKLPLAILPTYAKLTPPAPGVKWRANLYKCGDKTQKPHWLTWSKINLPQPDFHQPNHFGTFIFE